MSTLDDRLTAFAAACKVKFAALTSGLSTKLTVTDNSAAYGPGSVRIPGIQAAISAGDQSVYSMATLNSGNALHPNGAGCSIDLPGFVGGGWFGDLSASNRIEIHSYGTVAGWEFNDNPYVGTNVIFHGGNLVSVLSKVAGYTESAISGLQVRLCNLAAGFTVVLPTAVGNTARFTFKKMLAAGTITIDGNAFETIDGALTTTLTTQYDKLSIVSDGANWCVV